MSHEAAPTPTAPEETMTDRENGADQGTQEQEHQADLQAESQDRQNHEPESTEAKDVLHGIRFVDQLALEGVDAAMRKGEKVSATVEDKVFAMKDYYLRHRIQGTERKVSRYKDKSEAAVLGFRRRKYGRKMRLAERRLKGLNGYHNMLTAEHAKNIGIDADGNKITSAYQERRMARRKMLQDKVNRMLKVENGYYEDIGAGRKLRRVMKHGARTVTDKAAREGLKKLIRETSTVQGLEALGQGEFTKRLMELPIVRDTVRDAAMRLGSRFAEAARDIMDFDEVDR